MFRTTNERTACVRHAVMVILLPITIVTLRECNGLQCHTGEAAKNKQTPIRMTPFTNVVISSGVVLVPCAVAGHMFAQRFHLRPTPQPFKSFSLRISWDHNVVNHLGCKMCLSLIMRHSAKLHLLEIVLPEILQTSSRTSAWRSQGVHKAFIRACTRRS